jgi:hypothetical protein
VPLVAQRTVYDATGNFVAWALTAGLLVLAGAAGFGPALREKEPLPSATRA